jgi:two-component system response regulator DesR
MKSITVLLVDDMPAVRDALDILLSLEPDLTVVGDAADGAGAVAVAAVLQPDVVVMDYEMPGMNGIEATRALRLAGVEAGVVMLSIHDDAALKRAAADAGVRSFVAKHEPSRRLVAAIRDAAAGQREEDTS